MNIQTIAEHSIDIDLLPKQAKILDLGCRGFLFANELRRLGHEVFCVDPDNSVVMDYLFLSSAPVLSVNNYHEAAIAGENGLCSLKHSSDPQAKTIIKAKVPLAGFDIPMYTLEKFSEEVKVQFWDVIKMDIEGSEYEVIMSMERPLCKQLSWEAHLHTGVYGEAEILLMENKLLSLGYFPVQHDKTRQHGLSYNYWDSLFILQ